MSKITRIEPLPKLPTLKNVAAYARVSNGKDAMLHSLSSQISYFSEYIQNRRDWQFAGVFYDEAKTGTKENREGFQKMLAACRAGKVDMIIVKSITRFARNTLTILQSIRELKELGVDVFCQKENIHTLSFDGELMLTILAGFAQEESKSASDNQKWRIRHSFERGEVMCWFKLYGYRIMQKQVMIDPDEAAIVREAFERVISGESLSSIAKSFDARGLPRPMGGEWTHLRIKDMIRNEKYIGDSLCQKYWIVDHLTKQEKRNEGELPQYYVEGHHDPIVDKDTFMRANAVMNRFAEEAPKRLPQKYSAFTGKILCTNCGKNYCRASNGKIKIWICRTCKLRGPTACPAKQIHEDTLYAITTEVLGLEEFNLEKFHSEICSMRVEPERMLVYCFRDGHEVTRQWIMSSRRDSWTPEMKEKARQRYLTQKGQNDAESNRHTSNH